MFHKGVFFLTQLCYVLCKCDLFHSDVCFGVTQVFCCTMMTRVCRTYTSSTLSGCVTSWLASSPSGRSTVLPSQVWGAYHIQHMHIKLIITLYLTNPYKITSCICHYGLTHRLRLMITLICRILTRLPLLYVNNSLSQTISHHFKTISIHYVNFLN